MVVSLLLCSLCLLPSVNTNVEKVSEFGEKDDAFVDSSFMRDSEPVNQFNGTAVNVSLYE